MGCETVGVVSYLWVSYLVQVAQWLQWKKVNNKIFKNYISDGGQVVPKRISAKVL